MDKFLKALRKKYDLEDFTGNLGVLFADDDEFSSKKEQKEMVNGAYDFLYEIFQLAEKYSD